MSMLCTRFSKSEIYVATEGVKWSTVRTHTARRPPSPDITQSSQSVGPRVSSSQEYQIFQRIIRLLLPTLEVSRLVSHDTRAYSNSPKRAKLSLPSKSDNLCLLHPASYRKYQYVPSASDLLVTAAHKSNVLRMLEISCCDETLLLLCVRRCIRD